MAGKALEIALALWRMPSRRTALRQRPLPDDVGALLELAAGASGRIAEAAARADVTPAQLLEAVRFYASEILLHEGADAYRVLGVAPDAVPGQIKAHHRALQQWLHPDRRGDEWASSYATRVNVAWGELRSTERRAAYDARSAEASAAAETDPEPRRVLVTDWRAAPRKQNHWRGWAALAATVGVCGVLIVLIERQASVSAPEWVVTSDDASEIAPAPMPPELAALGERVAARLAVSRRRAAIASRPEVPAHATEPLTISGAPVVVAQLARHDTPTEAAPGAFVQNPSPAAASAVVVAPDADAVQKPAPKAMATPPRMTAKKPPAPAIATATDTAPVTALALAPARMHSHPVSVAMPTQVDALERVRLAHLRGREVTRYLTGPSNATPPIWRSVAAQDAGAAVRQRLDGSRSRLGRMFNSVRFGEPDWRIGTDHATMAVAIQRSGVSTNADPGTLQVKFAWREGMWLVDTIEAEDAP